MRHILGVTAAAIISIGWVGEAAAFDYLKWPDGRRVLVVQPNEQADLSSLRSGVAGRATDRRFRTNEAMYLANEIYLSGTEFFLRASERRLPIAHDEQFSYITNVEAYWYSRYNLISLSARSRAGIGVIHGPYVEQIAREATGLNIFGRERGELPISNKEAMLTHVIASFLKRSGLPRKFENAVPLMLEFKSADPHFVVPVDLSLDGNGRARYLGDFESLRWNFDRMDKTIDMGGVGQAMLKKILWAKFFLRRNHTDTDFPGEVFLGNNAEDGFRGSMLTLEAVSTMLMAKAALFTDARGRSLMGIDPSAYRPQAGLRYLPHEIAPELIYMTDMPVRHFDFAVKDPSSRLWDAATWLWATTEFFDYANPRRQTNWNRVFGYQTPYDGSVMEQKYALLSRLLANMVLDNLEAMHRRDGIVVSTWTPEKGAGASVAIADLALAVVALGSYADLMDLEPARRERAKDLLRQQADFLLRVAGADGSYRQSYGVPKGVAEGKRDATSQAFAIRALLVAYHLTNDARYLKAAEKTSATWNRDFWDGAAWLYRNEPNAGHVAYTPVDVAAALAALREMVLVNRDPVLLDRFKKFFVQSVDASGLMQAEDIFTGEKIGEVRAGKADSDRDGIPFLSRGHGSHGIDSVFAARVEFDLGKPVPRPRAPGVAAPRPTTGAQIFAANCAVCHGPGGIGNEGPRLVDNAYVQLTGRDGVMSTVAAGRVNVGMPSWDGILSRDEIGRVVDYIRALEKNGTRAQNAR